MVTLQIFDTDGLRPIQAFTFLDLISQVTWSPDSTLVLVVIEKRNLVYVRNVYDPDWYCKIDEGLAGLAYAHWSQDSRFVLTVSEFNVRMTVWDLRVQKGEMNARYIESPKFAEQGPVFSKYRMALVRRHAGEDGTVHDVISLYDTHKWHCLFTFTPELSDIAGIKFVRDHIIVWESALKSGLIHAYSVRDDKVYLAAEFSTSGCIRSVEFSPGNLS